MERFRKSLIKVKEEEARLRKEFKERTVGYILAALGLVAGLAWNAAISSAIDELFPKTSNTIAVKFLYAFLVTIVIVIVSVYLVRFTKRESGN